MDLAVITDADIARSRTDPRFKQVMLTKALEQLLGLLHRLQHSSDAANPPDIRSLREGAVIAVQLADIIRSIENRLKTAPGAS